MRRRGGSGTDVRRAFGGGAVTGVLATVGSVAVLVAILYAVRDAAYRATSALGDAAPDVLGAAVKVLGELGLVALVGLVVVLAWRSRSDGLEHVAVAAVAVLSSVVAYLLSEVVKGVVQEERPCRTLRVTTLASCPPAGDWSWPSNHAVIAGGLATVAVVLAPWWWRVVVPLALAVAASRVLTGAHYWHDVVAGLAVGVLVVWFGTWAVARPGHGLLVRSVDHGPESWRRLVDASDGTR